MQGRAPHRFFHYCEDDDDESVSLLAFKGNKEQVCHIVDKTRETTRTQSSVSYISDLDLPAIVWDHLLVVAKTHSYVSNLYFLMLHFWFLSVKGVI